MKNSIFLIFSFLLLAACQDDDFALENRDETIKGQ